MNHKLWIITGTYGILGFELESVENDDFSNSGETERQENVCSIDRCSKCNIYKGNTISYGIYNTTSENLESPNILVFVNDELDLNQTSWQGFKVHSVRE